jgi:hypothetical protein
MKDDVMVPVLSFSLAIFRRRVSRTVSMILYQRHTFERMSDDAQLQMCMN